MKKIANILQMILVFIGLFVQQIFGQNQDTLEKTLLWEISGKGIKKSYLFGTIHMIKATDFFFSKEMESALKKSNQLVTEIDLGNPIEMSLQMMSLAPMKNGTTLATLLAPEDYEIIRNYFKNSKNQNLQLMPFEVLEKWKPILLQSFLYEDLIDGEMKAYEMELMQKAAREKMKTGGLETVAEQIQVFEKIDYKQQAEELVEMIKKMKDQDKTAETDFQKLTDLYQSQSLDAMVDFSENEGFAKIKDAEQELLVNRNLRWIPKILSFSQKEKVFYAVGAAHLGGPQGVIRLLRRKGLTVKPVFSSGS